MNSSPTLSNSSKAHADDASRSGMIMMAMMILFGSITLLSIAAFMLSSTDVMVAGQYAQSKGSLFQAEAGIQAVKTRIQNDLASGTLTLDSAVETVNYTAPAGYGFDPVTTLTRLSADNTYYFTLTGRTVTAQTVVEATIERINKIGRVGIFGDDRVNSSPNISVYSYYSSETPNPSASDSSGEAVIGSNNNVSFGTTPSLDGEVHLGEDGLGNPATASGAGGMEIKDLGEQIDPDPLGANGGELDTALQFFKNGANNNNSDANPPITGNKHTTGNLTLPPGNYYLKDLKMASNQRLTIGGTPANPVRIFFEGQQVNDQILFQPNSELIFSSGSPSAASLQIYAMSSHDVTIQPKLDFVGMIYAPMSRVVMQPGGDFHGGVWGDDVDIGSGTDVWVDMSLLDAYGSDAIEIIGWKELRTN